MSKQTGLLATEEGAVVSIENVDGASCVLVVCEHASKTVPMSLGTLGLSPELLEAHIAWDPGALAVARGLSRSLDAALVYQNFSRLAYDCNRPPQAPDAMPEISEIHEIAGNRGLTDAQRQARVDAIYRPWQQALIDVIAARKAAGRETVIVTIHTFTPVYKGRSRDVEIGILHDEDSLLADAMLARTPLHLGYRVERNQPYGPQDGVTHTLVEHGVANGLRNVMIEVRNDLVTDEAAQAKISGLLAALVSASLEDITTRGSSKAGVSR